MKDLVQKVGTFIDSTLIPRWGDPSAKEHMYPEDCGPCQRNLFRIKEASDNVFQTTMGMVTTGQYPCNETIAQYALFVIHKEWNRAPVEIMLVPFNGSIRDVPVDRYTLNARQAHDEIIHLGELFAFGLHVLYMSSGYIPDR